MQNTADLAASESALTNAIAHYFAASGFHPKARPPARPTSCSNWTNEVAKEATVPHRPDECPPVAQRADGIKPEQCELSSTIYVGAYFAGTNSLRKLVPQFNGKAYVNNTLPDYTFGGILPDWPTYKRRLG